MLSDNKGIKLYINSGRKFEIIFKYVEIKQHPTKQSMDQIKKKTGKITKIFVTTENKSSTYQNVLDVTKSSTYSKIYICKCPY